MECKSKGTVRVETEHVDNVTRWMVIFVPDNDHSVKNGNDDCAVFFNNNPVINHAERGRILVLDTNRRGVSVIVANNFFENNSPAASLLWSAVATKMKVEIVISVGETGYPTLSRIVPAT